FRIADGSGKLLVGKVGQGGASLPLTPPARLAAASAVALPVAVMVYGLFAVRMLFRECAQGRALTVRAAHHLQVFAASVAVQAPLGPLTSTLLSAAASLAAPPGQPLPPPPLSLHHPSPLL